jgi:Helix-turn-helix domain
MSVKVMGQVWELDLPHQEVLVLLAMADHADHEGRHVRPSLALLAWKTHYSKRQVIRIIQALEVKRLIRVRKAGGGRGKATEYTLHLENGVKKSPFRNDDMVTPFYGEYLGDMPASARNSDKPNSVIVTPFVNDDIVTPFVTDNSSQKQTETVTFATQNSDIAMSPQPSLDPSEEKPKDLNPLPSYNPPPSPREETRVCVKDTAAIAQMEAALTAYTPGFETLRKVYPSGRLEGLHEAWQVWRARDLESRSEEIAAKVVRLVATTWRHRESRYIPLLKTWLDKGRYNDALVAIEDTQPTSGTRNPQGMTDKEWRSVQNGVELEKELMDEAERSEQLPRLAERAGRDV